MFRNPEAYLAGGHVEWLASKEAVWQYIPASTHAF